MIKYILYYKAAVLDFMRLISLSSLSISTYLLNIFLFVLDEWYIISSIYKQVACICIVYRLNLFIDHLFIKAKYNIHKPIIELHKDSNTLSIKM